MRRSLLLAAALILLCSLGLHAQQHVWWTWQHPLPTGSRLHAVAYLNDRTIVAAGANGTVLRSTDGGGSWNQIAMSTFSNLQTVAFSDELHGVVGGDAVYFSQTTDGGLTWTRRSIGIDAYLTGSSFATSRLGLVVGGSLKPSCALLRTTDGGESWTTPAPPTSLPLNAVAFVDDRHVWAVGEEGIIICSRDGGEHWTIQQIDSPAVTVALRTVYFHDTLNGLAAGDDGIILRTTNGGMKWAIAHDGPPFGSSYIYAMTFNGRDTGFTTGISASLRTVDGGATWQNFGVGTNAGFAIAFNGGGGDGIVAGASGTVCRTTDRGRTWAVASKSATVVNLNDVAFVDSATGVAVGNNGIVLRTSDAGRSWETTSGSGSRDLVSVACGDQLHCVAAAKDGGIYASSDGGATWKGASVPSASTKLLGIEMRGPLRGWAVGYSGTIYGTTDGGATWTSQPSGTTSTLMNVDFSDSLNGYAAGSNGTIIRTTNGGGVWTPCPTGQSAFFIAVSVVDREVCFVAASAPSMLRTTDGGATWTTRALPSTRNVSSMQFIDRNEGWVALEAGEVLHTTDGGQTWRQEPNHVVMTTAVVRFTGMSFTDARNGTIVGAGGSILRYAPSSEAGASPSQPVPIAGACGAVDQPIPAVLGWHGVPGALSYRLQVSADATFGTASGPLVLDRPDVVDTFRVVSGLAPGTTYYWRVSASNAGGTSGWSETCSITTAAASRVSGDLREISSFSLSEVRPNPSAGTSSVTLRVLHPESVRLALYDAAGRELRCYYDGILEAGEHSLAVGAEGLGNGIYLLRLSGAGRSVERRMVVIR